MIPPILVGAGEMAQKRKFPMVRLLPALLMAQAFLSALGMVAVHEGLARYDSQRFAAAAGALSVLGVMVIGLVGARMLRREYAERRHRSERQMEHDVLRRLSHTYDRMLERINAGLEAEVSERLKQTLGARHALIFGLAKLADYRDAETGAHLDRLCEYSELLARRLAGHRTEINEEWIACLRLAVALHDIGKVGVPDSVLLKPGRLTHEERELIKKHTQIGADTLIDIRRRFGDDPLVNMGIQVTLQHHEKWDGTGYPYRLKGDQIALSARIAALADFYDALTSERVYKTASTHEQTVQLIVEQRGGHFDPDIVDAFLSVQDRFNEIRQRIQGESSRAGADEPPRLAA
jgi:HD-GYP domain-containing protein (c-di-GMP phosphodiesterase class II)